LSVRANSGAKKQQKRQTFTHSLNGGLTHYPMLRG
jgi:hypothetical protein